MLSGRVLLCFGFLWIGQFASLVLSADSNEHVHIKLHVPQIIKKHTHTRTIFKHHYVKPKIPANKGLVNARLDPTFKLSRKLPNSLTALESGRFKSSEQVWKPQADYRAVESEYVPKKIKLNHKKNPFKLLEIMAEAQAEGHSFSPQSLYSDDYFDNDANEHIPDYMLSDKVKYFPGEVYQTADGALAARNAGKADLVHLTTDDKSSHSASSQYSGPSSHSASSQYSGPSWAFSPPTIETATQSYDWSTGQGNTNFKKQKLFTAALDSDEIETVKPKIKKNRKHRLQPTHDPTEDHDNILKLTRKPINLSNFTKYKNKFNVMSNLNTSI